MKNDIKKLYRKDPKLAIRVAKVLGYKIKIKGTRKYPSQDDAEFMEELTNALDYIYTGDSALGKDMMNKLNKIRLSKWDIVFGDKSPWATKRGKKGIVVVYDKDKAKKLGLSK